MAEKKKATTKKSSNSKAKKPAAKPKTELPKVAPETKPEAVAVPEAPKTVGKKPAKKKKAAPAPKTYASKLNKLKKGDYESQEKALFEALLAMEFKVRDEIPGFRRAALTQDVTDTAGNESKKSNPYVQEFRALVKDYAALFRAAKEICAVKKDDQGGSKLADLRSILKVV